LLSLRGQIISLRGFILYWDFAASLETSIVAGLIVQIVPTSDAGLVLKAVASGAQTTPLGFAGNLASKSSERKALIISRKYFGAFSVMSPI